MWEDVRTGINVWWLLLKQKYFKVLYIIITIMIIISVMYPKNVSLSVQVSLLRWTFTTAVVYINYMSTFVSLTLWSQEKNYTLYKNIVFKAHLLILLKPSIQKLQKFVAMPFSEKNSKMNIWNAHYKNSSYTTW